VTREEKGDIFGRVDSFHRSTPFSMEEEKGKGAGEVPMLIFI